MFFVFCFSNFGATDGSAQGSLLKVHEGLYGVLGLNPRPALCKASTDLLCSLSGPDTKPFSAKCFPFYFTSESLGAKERAP